MTTSGGSNASPSSQPIPITSLPIPELRGLREKLDMEVQRLQSSKIQLSRVLNAFHASNTAVHRLSKSKQGILEHEVRFGRVCRRFDACTINGISVCQR